MSQLISDVFVKRFGNKILNKLDDAAIINVTRGRIAFTTDSFTVKPLFFPGGDIGSLALCGTINDLAVQGARPIAIAASFIIEQGFLIEDLKKIVDSMGRAAEQNGVAIVTGDTKVVGKGEADGIFITTSAIGEVYNNFNVSSKNVKVGDVIIISGTIAEHGISILNARQQLGFEPPIRSDVASVYPLIKRCLPYGRYIHAMRDPTRGGLASVFNEIAHASGVGIVVLEKDIPIKKEVAAACDIVGLDVLSIANEGKVVFFVDAAKAGRMVDTLRVDPRGKNAAVVGIVTKGHDVQLTTALGTHRRLVLPEGEVLPRIC